MKLSDSDPFRAYEEKKAALCNELKQRSGEGDGQVSLYKETSNLFRSVNKEEQSKKIDVRCFNKILSIDPDKLIAEVEGMATYEAVVNEALKHGCLPAVVPELKSITVGGALAGCGIESSSFRYGLVHETVKEIEVLLSDGSVVICSPDNDHRDLFYAFPNSYGTLGYALKVKIRLIPTKKFIKLTHIFFSDPNEYFREMARLCSENRRNGSIAYIDGVIFDRNEMYITIGEPTQEAPFKSSYRYMDIYYRSIQTKKVDYLTTLDYIWRWDSDWFWCSKTFFMQNPVIRFLFGKFMLSSIVYTKIMNGVDRRPWLRKLLGCFRGNREPVIQDVLIPKNNAEQFLEFFQDAIGIEPIWICPTQPYSENERYTFCPLESDTLYFDFGFWDSVKTEYEEGFYNRKIENIAGELGGFKSLYSTSFYSEKEFWTIYDRAKYQAIKQKYDPCSRLKDLYEKTCG